MSTSGIGYTNLGQEKRLIFNSVDGSEQLDPTIWMGVLQELAEGGSRVVAGGHGVTAEFLLTMLVKVSELDEPIALDVGVGRQSGLVLVDQRREHLVPILLDKVHGVEGDVELLANPLGVLRLLVSPARPGLVGDIPVLRNKSRSRQEFHSIQALPS